MSRTPDPQVANRSFPQHCDARSVTMNSTGSMPSRKRLLTALSFWVRRVSHITRENWFRTGLVCLLMLLLLQYLISSSFHSKYDPASAYKTEVATREATALRTRTGDVINGASDDVTGGVGSNIKDFFSRQGRRLKLFLGLTKPPPPPCENKPPHLVGKVWISLDAPTWEELDEKYRDVEPGGRWRPDNCTSRHRVAIVLPYRDRDEHLRVFLDHMHPILMRQQLDYGIYVIEQDPYSSFNRGLLLNVGFVEAKRDGDYDCYIFHDVDLLPENDRNLYTCPDMPRHMSASVDEFGYKLPYDEIFGGVEAFRGEHFETINGFSNMYFGWGGEDDDLYSRITFHGYNITRPPMKFGRYTMIRHVKSEPSPNRYDLLDEFESRMDEDGLNSLVYDRKRLEKRKLYTLVHAQVNMTDYVSLVSSTTETILSSTSLSPKKKRKRKQRHRR